MPNRTPGPMPKPPEAKPQAPPPPRGLFSGPGDAPKWDDLKYRVGRDEYYGERSRVRNSSRQPDSEMRKKIIEDFKKLDTEGGGFTSQGGISRVFSKLDQKIQNSSGTEQSEWKYKRDLLKKWTEGK